ncbi:MAG: epsE 2 [Gammaproteobacteria bacterium]|jgi:type II secretory ATPase GspE/PulE/Tfp pilus assembly ATPase PilB-like protein|nr:epsE 2 [Gammaproteobacteria bacterium]
MAVDQTPENLRRFAEATGTTILTSQADLDPKDRAMVEMHDWCQQQGFIVVLHSGNILTSQPESRVVQNCKVVMINKGLKVGQVIAAMPSLINLLLANVDVPENQAGGDATFSVQQQRLRMLIKDALTARASDIHIEVREDVTRILFRKNGEMHLHAEWLPRLGREIASVAFNKETDSAQSHFNPLVPQDASMPLHVSGADVRLRLASMPAHGGFDVVMRILTIGNQGAPKLEDLGYTPDQVAIISKAVQLPYGAIVVSGPTGSGKTTTLASCLQMIDPRRKIFTIEDPVEKIVPNATQVAVNTDKEDRDFAAMSRASLRMDPDVIVLGEMRDLDTAKVMTSASITGHLVLSTIHTNNAVTIVTRLVDMGISASLLGDSNILVCLISQRLAPLLCQKCSIPIQKSPQHMNEMARWKEVLDLEVHNVKARVHNSNCAFCEGTGIVGRSVVAEVIWVDEAGRHFIQRGNVLGWELYLQEHGWLSLREHGVELVKAGKVDPFDAETIVGPLNHSLQHNVFDYKNQLFQNLPASTQAAIPAEVTTH